MNDVDIEMAELTERGNDLASGLCPACGDMLNPLDPKWSRNGARMPRTRCADGTYRETTPAEYAACVGPESDEVPGYHAWCVEEVSA